LLCGTWDPSPLSPPPFVSPSYLSLPPLCLYLYVYVSVYTSVSASVSDGLLLAAPGLEQQEIFLWDLRSKAPATTLRPMRPITSGVDGDVGDGAAAGMVTSLAFAPADCAPAAVLLAGYEDGCLYAFDVRRPDW
jgi:hypothetical protein